MSGFWQDLRHAWRSLARMPRFTCMAVLILALAIGANAAIYSVVDHVLLRPLAYAAPDRLYAVHEVIPKFSHVAPAFAVSANHFLEWKRTASSVEQMALLAQFDFTLRGNGEPEVFPGARVSADLFEMLGVKPLLGRTFRADEDQPGRDLVVILNHEVWRRRFGADPAVIGRTVTLNDQLFEIIGVLPADFRFPKLADLYPTTQYTDRPQMWKPIALGDWEKTGENFNYLCLARLKNDATVAGALGELDATLSSMLKGVPGATGITVHAQMVPLHDQITGRSATALRLLFLAVGFILLIGCVNLSNLLLAKVSSRRKEIAVRSAIGASPARLIRQALAESMLLSVVGAAVGLVVAHLVLQSVLAFAPADLPRMDEVTLDGRALAVTFALSLITSLLIGFLPAWHSAHADPQEAITSVSRTTTTERSVGRIRSWLVGTEVALTAACLVSGGLLLHSFVRLLDVDPGFDDTRLIALDIDLPGVRYSGGDPTNTFFRTVLTKIEPLPTVVAAGVTTALPFTPPGGSGMVFAEGVTIPAFERPLADMRYVSAGFFDAMGIPLIAGKTFTESDRKSRPAIISRLMAERLWPESDPIGRRFRLGSEKAEPFEVAGIVGDVLDVSLNQQHVSPTVYLPYWLSQRSEASLVVRTTGEPIATYSVVRQALQELDSELAIPAFRTMNDIVMASVESRRYQMLLVLFFGVVAVALASIGIYAVVSYAVAQQTKEIGVRVALGAASGTIMRDVIGKAMSPVAVGLLAGLVCALGGGRLLRGMLFGIGPFDLTTMLGVTVILLMSAFLASYLPARRAARVDPLVALRYE
jgi:putative ABC transport system permease protein